MSSAFFTSTALYPAPALIFQMRLWWLFWRKPSKLVQLRLCCALPLPAGKLVVNVRVAMPKPSCSLAVKDEDSELPA